jgi:hypothetical protein
MALSDTEDAVRPRIASAEARLFVLHCLWLC